MGPDQPLRLLRKRSEVMVRLGYALTLNGRIWCRRPTPGQGFDIPLRRRIVNAKSYRHLLSHMMFLILKHSEWWYDMPNCRLKRLLTVVLIIAWVCRKPASGCAPEISARAAILIEWQTGTVLMEKRGFVRMHPASLTKMMTALVALERGRLEDLVRVSEEAASQPGSSMHLRPGDVFTLEDLLYGLMLVSGNDAAWAIAEHIGKGLASEFFELMNRRAKELGAINTRFENPGLTHPNHYTTAFDRGHRQGMYETSFFKQLVATKEKDAIEAESGVLLSLENTNRLLWIVPGADGVKTGTTQAAGQCLVASATRDGMRLLSVVLDSATGGTIPLHCWNTGSTISGM